MVKDKDKIQEIKNIRENSYECIKSIGNKYLERDLTLKQKIVLGRFVSLWEYGYWKHNRYEPVSVSSSHLMQIAGLTKQGLINIKKNFIELGFIKIKEKYAKGTCTKYDVDMDKIKWYVSVKPVKKVKKESTTDIDISMQIKIKSLEMELKSVKEYFAKTYYAKTQEEKQKYLDAFLNIMNITEDEFNNFNNL